jgi:hypothetical protein
MLPSLPWCCSLTKRALSRGVFYAGMVALADALTTLAPAEKPIAIVWPDTIRFDGGLVGGGRIAWPDGADQVDESRAHHLARPKSEPSKMKDFWLSSGHLLTDRDAGGYLLVTDDLLKAYLARPELRPPPEACATERRLYETLFEEPRRRITAEEIAAIADADARQNWELMIDFRDRLVHHKTLEAAYLDLVRHGVGTTPPLFLNQLVHVILRNVLDRCEDSLVLRAAELFFRPQRMTLHEGSLIAADEETIVGSSTAPLSPLISMLGVPVDAEIDVLSDDNASAYWVRSDRFDMAIDLTAGRRGLAALGEAMSHWVRHMLSIEVKVEPLTEVRDTKLTWYVGLDAEATRIGNALWNGNTLDERSRSSVIGLYRLTFAEPTDAGEIIEGEPVYLILAMADKVLRMKPQNLLTSLPARHPDVIG